MNNNSLINDSLRDFLNPTAAELEAEKEKYGNHFMNFRKKLINETFEHMELENKFLDRFYLREAGIPEKKTDTPEPDTTCSDKSNKDQTHERYGHFLDKYL